MYDLINGYRNLGGNLMFLSSTNLLWKINLHGNQITRVAQWRTIGRPEARVTGVQYRANDEGGHSGAYELTPYGRDSWQFAGVDQSALANWHWFGIEFDMTGPASPPGTHVLAQVDPRLGNPAIRGQMTYYARGGAKVFAAGTMDFEAAIGHPPFQQLLENLWQRMAEP
jgi:hypothetical protein